MKFHQVIFGICVFLFASWASASETIPPVKPVDSVDFSRYVGKWYEIAAFPMFFQRQCVGGTTAEYTLKPNNEIRVINRCKTSDGFDQAEGTAWAPDPLKSSQLKVSFFWPFRSDYWVIGLDQDYRWAVVGNPNRKYLWILSRTPTLAAEQLEQAKQAAITQHYDLKQLTYTKQP